jgi:hypothetical protein
VLNVAIDHNVKTDKIVHAKIVKIDHKDKADPAKAKERVMAKIRGKQDKKDQGRAGQLAMAPVNKANHLRNQDGLPSQELGDAVERNCSKNLPRLQKRKHQLSQQHLKKNENKNLP